MKGTCKRRSEIKRLENQSQKMVSFSKRRKGLFKKAQEYSDLTGSHVAVLAFSPAGNPFVNGFPSFESVVNSYLNKNDHHDCDKWGRVVELENKAAAAQSMEELMAVKDALEEVRRTVLKKLKNLEEDEFIMSLLLTNM